MVQLIHLLIECKGITWGLSNSVTNTLSTIEAGRIETGWSFLGRLWVHSGMPDRHSHCTGQNKATKESCCTKGHRCSSSFDNGDFCSAFHCESVCAALHSPQLPHSEFISSVRNFFCTGALFV